MKREYLGDALDHWKGSLIFILRREGVINRIAVEPMLTDDGPWCQQDMQTYRRLLNLGENDELCHADTTFHDNYVNRQQYFDGVTEEYDLFLDPDVGISSRPKGRKYITIGDIVYLLTGGKSSGRVLMVYQHFPRRPFREWFPEIVEQINGEIQLPVPYCVYEGQQVAMLFISRAENHIQEIHRVLQQHLNGTAVRRIWGNI